MKYKIISGSNLKEFCIEINEEIQRGWEPMGGIAVNAKNETFYQAMLDHGLREKWPY